MLRNDSFDTNQEGCLMRSHELGNMILRRKLRRVRGRYTRQTPNLSKQNDALFARARAANVLDDSVRKDNVFQTPAQQLPLLSLCTKGHLMLVGNYLILFLKVAWETTSWTISDRAPSFLLAIPTPSRWAGLQVLQCEKLQLFHVTVMRNGSWSRHVVTGWHAATMATIIRKVRTMGISFEKQHVFRNRNKVCQVSGTKFATG